MKKSEAYWLLTELMDKADSKYSEALLTAMDLLQSEDLLSETPTADVAEVKWIDVNKRLPKKEGRYIVCTKNITGWKPLKNNVFICDYMFDDFIYMGWENNPVTHWMPLPQPPSGAKMDGKEVKQ